MSCGLCEQFIYGRCQGKDSRFGTEVQYQQECQSVPPWHNSSVCHLPADSRTGRGHFPKFYFFSVVTGRCEIFIWLVVVKETATALSEPVSVPMMCLVWMWHHSTVYLKKKKESVIPINIWVLFFFALKDKKTCIKHISYSYNKNNEQINDRNFIIYLGNQTFDIWNCKQRREE